eukprot:3135700-Rhodomonas_salina.1
MHPTIIQHLLLLPPPSLRTPCCFPRCAALRPGCGCAGACSQFSSERAPLPSTTALSSAPT